MARDTWHTQGTVPGAATFDDVTLNVLSATNGDAFRSYYAFGAARVAVRNGTGATAASAAPVLYLAADHLGSTTLALTTGGVLWGARRYHASSAQCQLDVSFVAR